jgi:hypothetical protein
MPVMLMNITEFVFYEEKNMIEIIFVFIKLTKPFSLLGHVYSFIYSRSFYIYAASFV